VNTAYTPEALSVGIDSHLFVIFGGTGDLARTKLLPALYRLLDKRNFSDDVHVLGVATRDIGDDGYRELVCRALSDAGLPDAREWADRAVHYRSIADGMDGLHARIEQIEAAAGLSGKRVFYLAVPPSILVDSVEGIGKDGLAGGRGWSRVVVEKPFGADSESATRLNDVLHAWFAEEQIYRIDHYLAKETVRNLLALRFANPLFESSWTRDRIDSVQITVAESEGIGTRARYYDSAGAIRDIIQNHALQIFTLVAMEPPVKATADRIRDEKVKVLRSTATLGRRDVVWGQYGPGEVNGAAVPGYLEEKGVAPDSTTETYAAMRLTVDNWRWHGVPFFIRAGKRLTTRVTQVSVLFREPPVSLFTDDGDCGLHPNVFEIRLQPQEGFGLSFEMKEPGEGYRLQSQRLKFDYADVFGNLPDAYETLLADVMSGDQTLFVRSDEVEEAWRIVEPVLDPGERPDEYAGGTWGPDSAARLMVKPSRYWLTPRF